MFDQRFEIINSEGPILALGLKEEDSSLFLEGTYNRHSIICRTNRSILKLYFNNKLRTRELFEVKMDGDYFLRIGKRIHRRKYSEQFQFDVLNHIECGEQYF